MLTEEKSKGEVGNGLEVLALNPRNIDHIWCCLDIIYMNYIHLGTVFPGRGLTGHVEGMGLDVDCSHLPSLPTICCRQTR